MSVTRGVGREVRLGVLVKRLLVVAASAAVLAGCANPSGSPTRTTTTGSTPTTTVKSPSARPDLQQILDALVTGPGRAAPGVTAYVSGPRGTWVGSAGLEDVVTGVPMPTDEAHPPRERQQELDGDTDPVTGRRGPHEP